MARCRSRRRAGGIDPYAAAARIGWVNRTRSASTVTMPSRAAASSASRRSSAEGSRRAEQVQSRVSRDRRELDGATDPFRQPGDSGPGELQDAVGERALQTFAGPDRAEGTRELQGVQRIALRELGDPQRPVATPAPSRAPSGGSATGRSARPGRARVSGGGPRASHGPARRASRSRRRSPWIDLRTEAAGRHRDCGPGRRGCSSRPGDVPGRRGRGRWAGRAIGRRRRRAGGGVPRRPPARPPPSPG